jgi:hypothetical protein
MVQPIGSRLKRLLGEKMGRIAARRLGGKIFVGVIVFLHANTYGAVIDIASQFSAQVAENGGVHLRGSIENVGAAGIYDLSLTLFIVEQMREIENLGDLGPGETCSVDSFFTSTGLKPGRYVLVVGTNFEELSGRPHTIYHAVATAHKCEAQPRPPDEITVQLVSPTFNLRSPFQRAKKIKAVMINHHGAAIHAKMRFYLPDGFRWTEDELIERLLPGEENTRSVSVTIDRVSVHTAAYFAVLHYELDNFNDAILIEGAFTIVKKPWLLRWYMLASGLLLTILVVRALLRKNSLNRRQWPAEQNIDPGSNSRRSF